MTYLDVVNKVLLRLRESRVDSFTSDYAQMIALFVKEAVDEVELAWSWNSLNTTVSLALVGGTDTYSLTGLGNSFIVDLVWNETKNYKILYPVPSNYLNGQYTASTSSSPVACGIYGVDSSGDPNLVFYPAPADADSVTVYAKTRSTYTGATTDTILCPWEPVYYGALWRAISEKGEDGGAMMDEIYAMFQKSLGDWIARDAALKHTNTTWYAG